jgi:thymidine kinase
MFNEPKYFRNNRKGWIEVICGCMFSGKTEELIRRINRAKIANLKTEVYKPATDTRYDEAAVVSHNSTATSSIPVESSLNILLLYKDAEVVCIDEAQFFDTELIYVCEKLAAKGIRVIIAGLDMDYLGKPFGPMPGLMAVAEYVTKVHAICMQCGDLATHSFRKHHSDALVMLGEKGEYEARCRSCFAEGMAKNQG